MLIRSVFARLASPAAVVLLSVAAAAACGSAPALPPAGLMSADQWLFEQGTASLKERKWFVAREYFRRLVDGYPQSPHRESAKLGVGDTYIGEDSIESNILAINEFREFLTFFPVSPRADYAQYRIALAYSRQMLSPQRDQTATKDAIREIETFMQRFPNSAHRTEVEALEREARDRLSQSEYEIGYFYARFGVCVGAIDRFRGILTTNPAYSRRDGVYFQIAECVLKNGLTGDGTFTAAAKAEALPWYERLAAEFEKSEFLERTRKRLAELKGG